jgi:hypothetical protein
VPIEMPDQREDVSRMVRGRGVRSVEHCLEAERETKG